MWRKGVLSRLIAAILFSICSQGVWASASCSGGGQVVSVTMPTSIAVPRDTPAGTALTGWYATSASTNFFSCSVASSTYTGAAFLSTNLTMSGSVYTTGGVTYTLFQTGVQGIGMAVAVRSYANGCGWVSWQDLGTPGSVSGANGASVPPSPWVGTSCNANGSVSNGGQAQVMFVTTGPVSAGSTTSGILFQAASFDTANGPELSSGPSRVSFTVTPTVVTVLSCTTPDVYVPLGTHKTTELTGVNTYTTSSSFNLSLNNCPAGMNTVQYRVDPTTALLNSAQSVVALDASSSATGIGVQLLDGTGAVFPLSTYKTFSSYDKSTGGSYTIAFKARYYQTAATVGPGDANTSMTVTVLYQ